MRPHIHTDILSLGATTVAVLTFAHVMRWGGAYLAGKGLGSFGTTLGAFASLN